MQIWVPDSRGVDDGWALPIPDIYEATVYMEHAVGIINAKGNSWGSQGQYNGQNPYIVS